MTPTVILDSLAIRLKPAMIEDPAHFVIFADEGMNRAARAVIMACQQARAWGPCSLETITLMWEARLGYGPADDPSLLDGLAYPKRARNNVGERIHVGGGYLVPANDGSYIVTTDFVEMCEAALQRRRSR